jgi:hypothetical protein
MMLRKISAAVVEVILFCLASTTNASSGMPGTSRRPRLVGLVCG